MSKNKNNYRHKSERVKTAKGRKKSSTAWINRHINDPYVVMSKKHGYRSRAAFKIKDIDDKFHIFKKCKSVVDLGAAPGGWLQVAVEKLGKDVPIIGVDLQEMEPIDGAFLIKGDFYEKEVIEKIRTALSNNKVDMIMSDMAPSSCGNKQVDHLRILSLVEEILTFIKDNLNVGGTVVAKMLRGGGDGELIAIYKKYFKKVSMFKPDSSYSDSAEMFLVAQDFEGCN